MTPVPFDLASTTDSGLVLVRCQGWQELRTSITADLTASDLDPFLPIRVLVDDLAARRDLSQSLATASGSDGLGVCAGVDFWSFSQLRRRLDEGLLGIDAESDPWRSRGLVLAVMDVLDQVHGMPGFEVVDHHLRVGAEQRPGRRLDTADRIAHLLGSYTVRCPEMVRAWARGEVVDAAGLPLDQTARWQFEIWTRVAAALAPVPGPIERADRLRALLEGSSDDDEALSKVAEVVAATIPEGVLRIVDPMEGADESRTLLRALARHVQVRVWALAPTPVTPLADRLGERRTVVVERWAQAADRVVDLPTSEPEKTTVLAFLQGRSPAPSRPDDSVQVHASHGLDRQVEVMREVLCSLFEDDPTLEPRQVVVACTDLAATAPLVRAYFCLDADLLESNLHPGHGLRVQLSDSSLIRPNLVLEELSRLLWLLTGRATAQDLVDIVSSAPVATRLGLGPDDIETVERLVAQAGIRWGLDAQHRARMGIGQVRQSTWLAGLDRILVGVAMGPRPPQWLATALPVDQIDSTDVEVAGKLAEFVSRVRWLAGRCADAADIGEWIVRLREAVDLLLLATGDDAWQLTQTHAELADLAEMTVDRRARLSLGDVRALFDRLLRTRAGRPNHGNGSLLVCSLQDVGRVSHRVVVVLGLDDQRFPVRVDEDGDDLCRSRDPETDRRAAGRQHLLDAVCSATEHFIVIHQGHNARTNEPLPRPIPLVLLDEAARQAGGVRRYNHTLMPHALTNFLSEEVTWDEDGSVVEGLAPVSFDRAALAGAESRSFALSNPPSPPLPLWQADLGVEPFGAVDLDHLLAFYRHPARELLKHSLGISMTQWDDQLPVELPVDLDGLATWQLGQRLVESCLEGMDWERVQTAEHLRGEIPPGVLGKRVLDSLEDRAARIARCRRRVDPGVEHDLDLVVDLGESQLRGRVRLQGNSLVSHSYSAASGAHLATAWVQLLALTVGERPEVGRWRAVHVGRDAIAKLAAPDVEVARQLLVEMVRLRAAGLQRLVPLPVKTAATLAGVTPLKPYGQTDPVALARKAWRSECDDDWGAFLGPEWDQLRVAPPEPDDPGLGLPRRFDQLAEWFFGPLRTQLQVENLR